MDAEEKPAESDNMKEQPLSAKNETSVSPNSSQDTAPSGHPRDTTGQLGAFGSPGDPAVYPPNIYAPQAQAFYYRGYDNATGEWDEYPPYINAEGLEIGSPGVYNDNPSLVFHAGYGYSPQMPYGPYSPVTTPLPSVGGDAQLYSPQQFPFSGPPYYQHLGPNMSYITSPTPVSQPEFNALANIDQQGDNMLFGPRPSYPPPVGSIGRGSFPGNHGFHDQQQGFDGLRSGGLWSDWSKPSDRNSPLTPFSPSVSPQPIGNFVSFGQNVGMVNRICSLEFVTWYFTNLILPFYPNLKDGIRGLITALGSDEHQASQQQRSFYGLGSGSNSYNRAYLQNGYNQGSSFGSASISSLGTNNRGWLSLENNRRRGRSSVSLCGCNGSLDILSEQNRGPRALKPKAQNTGEHGPSVENNKHSKPSAKIHDESYNQPDFVTEYKDAKFFIIKSYSEDNVHKSIKYGVWASTPNGNRKLDTTYREAKEKQDPCPVFLLFSAMCVVGESEHRNAVTLPTDIIKQMTKSFAQVVCLDESSKEGTVTDRVSSGSDGSAGARVKLEDGITTVSPSQTS
ncbi:hypothetical protein POTOM_027787 [Populus tomentosa]|uniref:YTH domain-containing family protein n=1 Tax=Populus tomentosa TaxID=118781 RepID=A0A8X7ZB90_POPTO|nr:hypothetical protein POTOM_027787 [Populus tomentosa]